METILSMARGLRDMAYQQSFIDRIREIHGLIVELSFAYGVDVSQVLQELVDFDFELRQEGLVGGDGVGDGELVEDNVDNDKESTQTNTKDA